MFTVGIIAPGVNGGSYIIYGCIFGKSCKRLNHNTCDRSRTLVIAPPSENRMAF